MAEPVPMWWETRREPVQLALEIPIGPDSDSPKPPKVRKGCMLVFGAIVLRLLGLVVAVGTIALGAWCFFKIIDNLSLTPIVKLVAQGIFYIFIGGLSLLAELRTRWTMRGCLSTYILFANHLARGLLYLALGACVFGLDFHDPPIVQKWWVASFILLTGGLNVIYYPFYWKYQRSLAVYKSQAIPLEPYPEEIIYGMDTLYIKNNTTVPLAPLPSPAGAYMEGANMAPSPSIIERVKEKEKEFTTPGEPMPISIVVEPAPAVITSSMATAMQCSGGVMRENRTTELAATGPIGVGAS